MYLDMVVPPGGILARISPPDGKASYLGFNDNPVKKIWISDNGILFPHHYEVFKPNLAIIGPLGPKTPKSDKSPPPEGGKI